MQEIDKERENAGEAGRQQALDKGKEGAKDNKPAKKSFKDRLKFFSSRRPLPETVRYIIAGLAIPVFASAIILIYLGNKPLAEEVENTLYTYNHRAEAEYRVKLLPNSVFEDEWQPEGNIYPKKLTDLIYVNFNSDFKVSNGSKLSGDYTVEVVLHAFQVRKETKSTVYEKKYRLSEGVIDGDGEFKIQENAEVKPSDYEAIAEQMEKEMGGSTEKECYVILSGTVYVEDEQSPLERTFSQRVDLPVNSSDVYYQIDKPEAVNESEEITAADTITVKQSPVYFGIAAAALLLGALLLVTAFLLTRNQDEEELRKSVLKKIMKKSEEKIVIVPNLPPMDNLTVLELFDFEVMLNHSEDIRELILVQDDGEHLPLNNKFYLFASDKVYVYEEKF